MAHPQTSLEPADDPLDAQTWAANWIGLTGAPAGVQPNLWLCFRKTLRLENVPGRVQVRIAAESKYWLWVNGRLLVFEGGLKRGPAPDATWFDELDLADALRPGDNTFALLVWYFGKDGFSHNNSGKPGLLFEERFDRRVVLGDSGWRVIRHPAYCDTGEPHPNYRLPESNIRFDAGCDIPGWVCVGYDDSNWPKAVELGRPPCAPWGRLILRTIPQWRDAGPRHYRSIQIQHAPDGACVHRARLPYNAQVTPCLDIEAPAGLTIDIRTDQYIDGGEPTVRAEYVTRDGRQAYESLGWMHGQEVCYTLPAGIRVHGLTYRETGYDTDITGHFRCDDEALNTLWTKSARTLYLNMRDTFFDTPGRERAQWWGDVVIMLSQVFYGCDRRAHALVRKAIRDLVSWQRPDKVLFSPTPAGNYRDELPMQMLASVGYYGFWMYYLHTGDTGLIERVYPAVRSYLGLWGLGDDGLVVQRPGDWTWGDWGDNKDLPLLYNSWRYALAAAWPARMAELIGRERKTSRADRSALWVRCTRILRTGSARRLPALGTTHRAPDDCSHALAVLTGLVDAGTTTVSTLC
ncbi:MAG: hypothetical protein R3C45_21780 [Phycisphaerales bacterium]